MKMLHHSSASVSFSHQGKKILFDPWLTDAAFLGSWRPWPDPVSAHDYVINQDWDYIIFTHFHSDHYDRKFLKEYYMHNKQRINTTKILIVENTWPQLEYSIRNLIKGVDLKIVISGRKIQLSDDFFITLYASDWCDPSICGKMIPCYSQFSRTRSFDSVAIIEGSGTKILNLNDAVGSSIVQHLVKQGIKVDVVMGVYGAAGSYPQCLEVDEDMQKNLANNFVDKAINLLIEQSKKMKAKYIFPFAGQYVLVGSLARLNSQRAILSLPKAASQIANLFEEVFTLQQNGGVEFRDGFIKEKSDDFLEPDKDEMSLYLHKFEKDKYYYQLIDYSDSIFDRVTNLSKSAFISLKRRYEPEAIKGEKYSINFFDLGKNHIFSLDFSNKDVFYSSKLIDSEQYCNITADIRLFEGCMGRKSKFKSFTPMHWNQAHIGSHLTFDQTNYDGRAQYYLNFMHN